MLVLLDGLACWMCVFLMTRVFWFFCDVEGVRFAGVFWFILVGLIRFESKKLNNRTF